jgi:hypothetical protein
VRNIQAGKEWKELFPNVAKLNLTTDGSGLNVTVRLTKRKGEPVHLVPEGTPGATVVAVKRVDELGFYSLGLNDLAKKVGLSSPKTLAVVRRQKIQDSTEYYKAIRVGKSVFKRYSPKAVKYIRDILPGLDMDAIWRKFGPVHRGTRSG